MITWLQVNENVSHSSARHNIKKDIVSHICIGEDTHTHLWYLFFSKKIQKKMTKILLPIWIGDVAALSFTAKHNAPSTPVMVYRKNWKLDAKADEILIRFLTIFTLIFSLQISPRTTYRYPQIKFPQSAPWGVNGLL